MTIVGCKSQVTPTPPPPSPVWKSTYLSIDPKCPSGRGYCEFVITVDPFDEDAYFDLNLHADYGIKFHDDLLPDKGISLADAGEIATIKGIHVQPAATRTVYIPFSIRSDKELTGEYIVDVKLMRANQPDSVVDQLQIKAFIQNGGDNNSNHGSLQLVRTQADFDARYPFSDDKILASFIRLDQENEYPRQGNLYVKLVAPHADYRPTITLHGDGVEIQQFTLLPIMANTGEVRIVEFQFRIIEGKQASDGLHVFSISVEEDNYISIHQTLPVAVEIISDADTHQRQWLAKAEVAAESTAGKTAADYQHQQSSDTVVTLGPIEGFPVPGYSETVVIVGQSESYPTDVVDAGIGGGVQPEPACTPTPPDATPAPPTPSPMPPTPSPVPPAVVAGGHDGASVLPIPTVKTAVDPRCREWQHPIPGRNGLTLLGVYHEYVEEKISEMRVNYFVVAFRLCNDIGTEVGEVLLDAGRIYYLPNDSRP